MLRIPSISIPSKRVTANRVAGARPQSTLPVSRLLVVGSGLMGSGIVQSAAVKDVQVTMVDANAEAVERGLGMIRGSLQRIAKKGYKEASEQSQFVDKVMSNISTGTNPQHAVEGAELVVEAIVENLKMKQKLFKGLDEAASGNAICGHLLRIWAFMGKEAKEFKEKNGV